MDYKEIISVVTVILTFAGYIPYIIDVFKKKTKPHSFTWFIWALAGFIAYGLQVQGGAGVGSWPLLTAASLCLFILILSLKNGRKEIRKIDYVFLVLALISLFLWIIVKQPVISVILITTVELSGFLPTIRKSWNKPYSETLFTYQLSAFRHTLSVFGLQSVNLLTALYPIAWAFANLSFTLILMARRKKLRNRS